MYFSKRKKPVPFDFALEALASLSPITKPMFGCVGIYVDGKIVLILRDRKKPVCDDGVWICTSAEHHESLRPILPNMRTVSVFETKVTGWQVLAAESEDFEAAVFRACDLILRGDPRIGRLPTRKNRVQKKSNVKSKNMINIKNTKILKKTKTKLRKGK